jgi:hypothetical protein
METHRINKKKEVQDNSFHQKATVFWTWMEWCWWVWWQEARQSIQTRASQPSINWNSVTGECSLTGIQETCWFSTTIPALTQFYEPRRQLSYLVGLCSPILPIVLIWHHQIFFFLGPLKDTLRGTRFEDNENVIHAVRTWLHEQEMSWYRKGSYALVLLWCKAVDSEIMWKNNMYKGNIQLYYAWISYILNK